MSKRTLKNTGTGACIGGGLGFTLNLIQQLNTMMTAGHSVDWQTFKTHYDLQQALRHTLIGTGLGAGAGLVYSLLTEGDEVADERFNQNDFLKELLNKFKVDPKNQRYQSDWKVVRKVCEFLTAEFAEKLLDKPLYAGSSAKRTAIHPASDYDVAFVLRPEAGTLESVRESFYKVLAEKFSGPGCSVRQQNYTVGLLMDRVDGSTLKIDIMPARGRNNYHATGDLTIWSRKRKKPLKTNVDKHNQMTVGKPQSRDTIRLLKLYKDANGLRLPTPLVNQAVPMGLQKRGGYSSLAGNLRFSLAHVADKLNNQAVRDVANGNNNLCGSLTQREKQQIQKTLLTDLQRWNNDPHYLKTMFPDVLV